MQKDEMANLLVTIESDCKANNILIFYGFIEENDLSPVSNVEDDNNDWKHYLNVLKALDARVINVSLDKNEVDDYDPPSEFIEENIDKERKPVYKAALAEVKKHQGKIGAITINFFHGLMNYQFTNEADWYNDIQLVNNMFDKDDDFEDDDENDEVDYPDHQIELIARSVVTNGAYKSAKNAFERKHICYTLNEVDKVESYRAKMAVMMKSEAIFMEEIFPKLEKELAIKIQKLKAEGYKKVQVKGMLNISDNTLNKHWYTN